MKVFLYMAITPNGLIARTNDDTNWSAGESESYITKVKEFKNMIVGRRTYELMLADSNKDSDINELGNPFVVVLTRNRSLKNTGRVHYVYSPQEAIKLLQDHSFTQIVVAGGSQTCTSFIKDKLIDEIFFDIEPVLFGQGIPLFTPHDFEINLELLETKPLSPHTLQLHYKVVK